MMLSGRTPFEAQNSLAEMLKASSGLNDAFERAQTGGVTSLTKMFREQEILATRMALVSLGRDVRSDALDVALGLQRRVESGVDSYLAVGQARLGASTAVDESMRLAESLAAHERALESAVHEFASRSLKDRLLDHLSPAEYAWKLVQHRGDSANITDYLVSAHGDRASFVDELYERYLSSPEFSSIDFDSVEDHSSRSDSSADLTLIADLEAATTQSKAVEAVVCKMAGSPAGFQRGQGDQYRIALITIYLSVVFALMDQVRWHLDNVERQREAAESAKDRAALVEQTRQAAQASERLNRTLHILLEQAIEREKCVVGERSVTVRSLPGSGERLGTAYTNQEVLVTDKSTRWVKIRFRDHLQAREVEGWVLKHYLQPIGSSDCGSGTAEAPGV